MPLGRPPIYLAEEQLLIVLPRDLAELRPVYDSLEELTAAADDAITAAMGIAAAPGQFTVLALGRLGSREFDIASDADLLFLREERLDARKAARAAEQIVEALAAYTRDGTVFAVDPRLRVECSAAH